MKSKITYRVRNFTTKVTHNSILTSPTTALLDATRTRDFCPESDIRIGVCRNDRGTNAHWMKIPEFCKHLDTMVEICG